MSHTSTSSFFRISSLVKKSLLVLSLFAVKTASAQVTFTSWVHPPDITLYATSASSTGVGSSAAIVLDDAFGAVVNIGFNFNFYGTTYNQCVIGANGRISFDSSVHDLFDPWIIDTPLASNANLRNCICGPYTDLDVRFGGEITYFTTGTAPNRMFVLSYCHDAMYSCNAMNATTQIILYEGTNIAETHIGHTMNCSTWNGGYAIVGVQNAAGTAATAAPGRDYPTVWTTTGEAWQFTPDATFSSYSVGPISYAPLPYYTIYWMDSTTGALLGSGDSLVVSGSLGGNFMAAALSCSDTGATGLDTTAIGYLRLASLAVNDVKPIKNMSIYPNPVTNELNIDCDVAISNVCITNLLGQTIINQNFKARKANVNTSTLAPGVYLLKVNGSTVRKFVKE